MRIINKEIKDVSDHYKKLRWKVFRVWEHDIKKDRQKLLIELSRN